MKLNQLLQFSSFLVLEVFSRHKQTATTNKPHQQPFPQTFPSVFSSGAFLFSLCSCLTPSRALLTSVHSPWTPFNSPPLTRGLMFRENTAGSCQWLLTVTWATSPTELCNSNFSVLFLLPRITTNQRKTNNLTSI